MKKIFSVVAVMASVLMVACGSETNITGGAISEEIVIDEVERIEETQPIVEETEVVEEAETTVEETEKNIYGVYSEEIPNPFSDGDKMVITNNSDSIFICVAISNDAIPMNSEEYIVAFNVLSPHESFEVDMCDAFGTSEVVKTTRFVWYCETKEDAESISLYGDYNQYTQPFFNSEVKWSVEVGHVDAWAQK